MGFSISLFFQMLEIRLFKYRRTKEVVGIILTFMLILVVVNIATGGRIVNAAQHRIAVHRFNNLTNQDFLYDFNYLVNVLEENWPFFNLSISANGVDVHELADNMRVILNDPGINNALDFLDALRVNFLWPINQLGHLRAIIDYDTYFTTAQSIEYWKRFLNFDPEGTTYEAFLRTETTLFYELLRDTGGITLHHDDFLETPDPRPVIETAIIKEGEIAHLTVNRMINSNADYGLRTRSRNARLGTPPPLMGHYEEIIYNFYLDVANYNHLIIDIRGNPGGLHSHFDIFVASVLVDDLVFLPAYVFYLDGIHSRQARSTLNFSRSLIGYTFQFIPRNEVRLPPSLPYFDDSIDFLQAFESAYELAPNSGWRGVTASSQPWLAFNGKAWLIVDEHTASAAEAVTAMFKYNNIATVVGETTRGLFGTLFDAGNAMVSLPHTGILIRFDVAYFTDTQGRPLNAGITPHYFNRPGMDALETVIAMINEMED